MSILLCYLPAVFKSGRAVPVPGHRDGRRRACVPSCRSRGTILAYRYQNRRFLFLFPVFIFFLRQKASVLLGRGYSVPCPGARSVYILFPAPDPVPDICPTFLPLRYGKAPPEAGLTYLMIFAREVLPNVRGTAGRLRRPVRLHETMDVSTSLRCLYILSSASWALCSLTAWSISLCC